MRYFFTTYKNALESFLYTFRYYFIMLTNKIENLFFPPNENSLNIFKVIKTNFGSSSKGNEIFTFVILYLRWV